MTNLHHPLEHFRWVGVDAVVILLGNAFSGWLGLPKPGPKATGPWHFLALDVMLVFSMTLVVGGGLEEPEWRSRVSFDQVSRNQRRGLAN